MIKIKTAFSTTNILVMLGVANLMMVGVVFSYFQYTSQIADQYRISTNNTTTGLLVLTKAIHDGDNIDDNRTQLLLKTTVEKSDRNYNSLINSSNQTNTLIKFLVDNFGENSDYLEKENFQYKQANDTFNILKEIRDSLKNQTN